MPPSTGAFSTTATRAPPTAAVTAAVRVGLFELLEKDGPLDADRIRERLGYHARPLRALLAAL